jgi:hypothetical protein
MKLTDLEPEWLTPDVFIFKNPTGGKSWLTCKRVEMTLKEQYQLVYGDWDDEETKTKWCGKRVVFCDLNAAWNFIGNDFSTLTVTSSIDASRSGDWHGFITNGEIT